MTATLVPVLFRAVCDLASGAHLAPLLVALAEGFGMDLGHQALPSALHLLAAMVVLAEFVHSFATPKRKPQRPAR